VSNRTHNPVIKSSPLIGAKKQFPNAIVQGHKDFKGVVKACPSFEAKKEYASY